MPQPWPYGKSTINETSLGHLYLLHQQSGMELQFARPWTACPQQEIPSPYLHWLKVLLASHKRMLHTKAFCYNKDASAKVANFNSFLEQQKKKKYRFLRCHSQYLNCWRGCCCFFFPLFCFLVFNYQWLNAESRSFMCWYRLKRRKDIYPTISNVSLSRFLFIFIFLLF